MTVAAGLPGMDAFAAFYARFADAVRAGGLRSSAAPLADDLLTFARACSTAWPELPDPAAGRPQVGSLRKTLEPWLLSAEVAYQQWVRSPAAGEWIRAVRSGWAQAAPAMAASPTTSAMGWADSLREWGLPAESLPRTEVETDGAARLYRYRSARGRRSTPLLIVYALVNRPSILDLEPERSLIRGLVEAGRDVYLLDWGDPSAADHERPLDDYVLGTLARAVTAVGRGRPIDVLGVCQGGVLSLLYAASQPHQVRRLVTMVTPVDFHTDDDLLSHWSRSLGHGAVDGSQPMPGWALDAVFQSLAPFRIGLGKVIDLLDHIHDDAWVRRFRRMERWVHDCPDQPARFGAAFLAQFYQQNCLMHGPFAFGGGHVDLRQIRSPLLNIYGLHDHIVPNESSRALAGLTRSTRYAEIAVPTGHIGMFVSARAADLPRQIAGWLARR